MSQNIKPTFIFIATLGILSMLPPLGVDMYIPSFLNIAEDLNIDSEQVQHTLTFFAYGMAAGQLFWGPFGDSFGRKPIILLGVIIGAITAIILTGILLAVSLYCVSSKASLVLRLLCFQGLYYEIYLAKISSLESCPPSRLSS